MTCRFNGHCSFFYSVALHCINIALELKDLKYSPKIQLYGLLHDAAEAYICDLPKPVKEHISQYKNMEARIQNKIWEAFNIPSPSRQEYKLIKALDDSMMLLEAEKLMKDFHSSKKPEYNLKTDITPVPMETAEAEFIRIGLELLKQI